MIYDDNDAYRDDRERGPTGIGGWLSLLLLLMVVFFLKDLFTFITEMIYGVMNIMQLGASVGLPLGHSTTMMVLGIRTAGWLVLVVLEMIAIFLFMREYYLAPRFVIIWLAYAAVFIPLSLLLTFFLPYREGQPVIESSADAFCAIAMFAIWFPYLVGSRRVEETFIVESISLNGTIRPRQDEEDEEEENEDTQEAAGKNVDDEDEDEEEDR